MKVVESETKAVDVLTDIICNKCGKSCMRKFDEYSSPPGEYYGAPLIYTPGYLSTGYSEDGNRREGFSDDGNTYSVDICERCIFEFFSGCKIPAEVV